MPQREFLFLKLQNLPEVKCLFPPKLLNLSDGKPILNVAHIEVHQHQNDGNLTNEHKKNILAFNIKNKFVGNGKIR